MITNGYLLMPERIERLNRAGLDHMQISIDNVEPDEISKKSLKVLDKKLQFLSEYADFHVNINSVVGGGIKNPAGRADRQSSRAVSLGFTSTIGIIHDGRRSAEALKDEERRVYFEVRGLKKKNYSRFNKFQDGDRRRQSPTTGAAVPAHATSTSAKTGWCTTVRSSVAGRVFRWPSTPAPASQSRVPDGKDRARPTARSPACTRSRTSITGDAPQTRQTTPGQLVKIQT